VHGVALDDPTVLHFGCVERDIAPDKERPIYFRLSTGRAGLIELNFFPKEAGAAVSEFLFDNCRNEIELILKLKDLGHP
jgi:hypothetical protein